MTGPARITLLTRSPCELCDEARDIIDRVRRDHPLQVTEIDLGSDEGQRLAAGAGVQSAPGVVVDGQPFGFGRVSEPALRSALDARMAANPPTSPRGLVTGYWPM